MILIALAVLPERDCELLLALYFGESQPTYEEVAGKLCMPVASTGPTRARVFKKLHRILR